MLVGKSNAWQGRDNAESVEFDPDKPCERSTASGKNSFGFLIALSENGAILVFLSMMLLAVFLASVIVLRVLSTAVRAAFSEAVIDLYFLSTAARAAFRQS